MKLNRLAPLVIVAGLVAGGAAAGLSSSAQAAPQWKRTEKVCQDRTAGTVCLEQRTNTDTGVRQSRMVITPAKGQWIRPDVHAVFGWDFGSEGGACGQEGCAKVTKATKSAWIRQRDEVRGLGYSTPQGRFNIYLGQTKQQLVQGSGWKAENPGRVAAQFLVKLKNNKTHYTGRLRLQSVDGVSIQPRTLKIELLRNGQVKASASKSYQVETEEVDWTSDVTKAVRMPSKGFSAIRVTGTYETPSGRLGKVSTTYSHGR
ncbi:hypothetical protein ASG90_00300 [Nocardioides sp. Soil797]|nr:hypothetical protein ASG90_00300 [Nocardioides sp. Soil797]